MEPIEECLTFLLGKAQQRSYQIGKQLLQPYGVTPVQYAMLHLLYERDGQNGAELGERLRLDSATMTGLIDRMAQNRLVERRPDPCDRRVNQIFVTDRGQELQAVLHQSMQVAEEETVQALTDDEVSLLKNLLYRIGLHEGEGKR
ncbi:MarR family transcriptional regulator [Brevibacillus fluminis]|uniref:MarR family transcriptional regulator n=1 Tax=Brevibacillus fluminis TaxID=511487 RepID=A0A3M8D9N9_9BACL|nr:MarR family transcriptional regulator [Brevibacillus fluminis]RNB84613.1 MarR family transcriptional regulator [Brevibacillus fluminis]